MGISRDKGPTFFDLLTMQSKKIVSGMELLTQVVHSEAKDREKARDHLHDVEHEADEINHNIVRKMNQTFVTPLDREDLGFLASRLDDCMDLIDEAGDLFVLYKVDDIPEPVYELLIRQMDVLTDCANLTAENMPRLKRPAELHDYWVEINRLENQGDKAYRKTLKTLFDSGLDPVTIIKLKDIVEALEECTDAFEDLANTIESIAVKES